MAGCSGHLRAPGVASAGLIAGTGVAPMTGLGGWCCKEPREPVSGVIMVKKMPALLSSLFAEVRICCSGPPCFLCFSLLFSLSLLVLGYQWG